VHSVGIAVKGRTQGVGTALQGLFGLSGAGAG
jgi:hypothetical protein